LIILKLCIVHIILFSYKENWEQAELNMLRKTMGMSMPLKLSVERKAASRSRSSPLLFCGQLEGADRAGHGHGLRRHVRQSEELREHDRLSIQCHAEVF
jgi:hypothetical protein